MDKEPMDILMDEIESNLQSFQVMEGDHDTIYVQGHGKTFSIKISEI